MHDDRGRQIPGAGFEGRLRDALRAEAEAAPSELTVADLDLRWRRRRSRRTGRFALVAAAAASLVVAVGVGGLVAGRPAPPPPSGQAPTARLPSLPAPAGRILLDDGRVPPGGVTWIETGERITHVVGRYAAGEYRLQFTCVGAGELSWSLEGDGSNTAEGGTGRCAEDLPHSVLSLTTAGPGMLVLEIPTGTAWRAILSEFDASLPAELSDLRSLIGNVVVDHREDPSDGPPIVEWRGPGVALSDRYVIQIACFGPGTVEWALGGTIERPAVLSSREACERGDAGTVESAAPPGSIGTFEVLVRAPREVAWRIMVEAGDDHGPVVPPLALVYIGDEGRPTTPDACLESWTVGDEGGDALCEPTWPLVRDTGISIEAGDRLSFAVGDGWMAANLRFAAAPLVEVEEVVGDGPPSSVSDLTPIETGADGAAVTLRDPGEHVVRVRGEFRKAGASLTTSYYFRVRVRD